MASILLFIAGIAQILTIKAGLMLQLHWPSWLLYVCALVICSLLQKPWERGSFVLSIVSTILSFIGMWKNWGWHWIVSAILALGPWSHFGMSFAFLVEKIQKHRRIIKTEEAYERIAAKLDREPLDTDTPEDNEYTKHN